MKFEDKKIIFMGTPDFAVESLKTIHIKGYNIVGVITAPDKPSGRGKKISKSAVKIYAENNNLNILQPTNLKSPEFLETLRNLQADLQIVVAFRMLPELVWAMPPLGTINLHASLLPDYRGAAPINYAVINGESKTGITTFFIEKEIDTGKIIKQKEIEIKENKTAGELHDELMTEGAVLMLETINEIFSNNTKPIAQLDILKGRKAKLAPKIFKDDCKINWNTDISQIHNFIRGLSPYPAAWTEIVDNNNSILTMKILKAEKLIGNNNNEPLKLLSDNKTYIKISVNGGFINIKELQLQGKKKMDIKSFLNGFDISNFKLL